MDKQCVNCLEFDDQKIRTQPCPHRAYNLLGIKAMVTEVHKAEPSLQSQVVTQWQIILFIA